MIMTVSSDGKKQTIKDQSRTLTGSQLRNTNFFPFFFLFNFVVETGERGFIVNNSLNSL